MTAVYIASQIFISAMAVFGLWCLFQLIIADTTVYPLQRNAIRPRNAEDLERIEYIVCEMDRSAFFAREEKYALLLDREMMNDRDLEELIRRLPSRVELYAPIESAHAADIEKGEKL